MTHEITEAEYAAAIPPWCGYRTLQQHMRNMALCWGLCRYVERGEAKPESTCVGCDLYSHTPSETGQTSVLSAATTSDE